MAAPTVVTVTWAPATLQLTIEFSEAVSRGTAWGDGKIKLRDAAGREFANTAAAPEDEATDTLIFAMESNGNRDTDPSELDIGVDAVMNGAEEGIEAVDASPIFAALNETLEGLNYDDVLALNNTLALVTAGTLDATTAPASDNIDGVIATGLLAAALKTPRTEDRAWDLVDAWDRFSQSAKNFDDFKRLGAAVKELKGSLNPRGSFAELSIGL